MTTYNTVEFHKHIAHAIAALTHAIAYSPDNRTVNDLEATQERLQSMALRVLPLEIKARFDSATDALRWAEQYQNLYNITMRVEVTSSEQGKVIVLAGTKIQNATLPCDRT